MRAEEFGWNALTADTAHSSLLWLLTHHELVLAAHSAPMHRSGATVSVAAERERKSYMMFEVDGRARGLNVSVQLNLAICG